MHEEYARQLLGVLQEQDRLADARRRGVDPSTLEKPSSRPAKTRLDSYFVTQPRQLERHWQAVMGAYETAFGEDAADAFAKAIRARHANVRIVTTAAQAGSAESHTPGGFAEQLKHSGGPKIIARLPVPRALRHAVTAGHFGRDENGPVNPGPDEVRDITENHAEELVDLLAALDSAEQKAHG